MAFHINVRALVYSLSDALDLVGVDELHHGKRVAAMCMDLAEELGFGAAQRDDLFIAAILHDCGVSRTGVHRALVSELDWEGSLDHCVRGEALLRACPMLSQHADVVRYHHTHWQEFAGLQLPEATAQQANLVFLADRIDALIAQHRDLPVLTARQSIQETVNAHAGRLFAEHLVDAFNRVSARESFWLDLAWENLQGPMLQWINREGSRPLSFRQVRDVADLFASVVDAKSGFTAEHSRGVARLARHLGEKAGLAEETCERLEIAGLLHDLGKLRVPDHILDKPMALTPEEFALMQQHSFDSFSIIGRINGMEDIALWAGYHHETLAGDGYPFHYGADRLSLEARIIAVADVFQALAQDRPYRKSLDVEQIQIILDEMVVEQHLDGTVVDLVRADPAACWQVAVID